ncbi:MAG: tetratricopeptide repeat protein [Christensenellaceae bacterium]|nr:tetratricopeptide repeat protein [Christensenellaceae bacterium]
MDLKQIIEKLDRLFHIKDFEGAEKLLLFEADKFKNIGDFRSELSIRSELVGLYRKLGEKEKAFVAVKLCDDIINNYNLGIYPQAGDVYISCGTACVAFNKKDLAEDYFLKAEAIYNKTLDNFHIKKASLYNNWGTAYNNEKARIYITKALNILLRLNNYPLELAMTYLNLADTYHPIDDEKIINDLIEKAFICFDKAKLDEYYAFVCSKCIPVFEHYGYVFMANTLKERLKNID